MSNIKGIYLHSAVSPVYCTVSAFEVGNKHTGIEDTPPSAVNCFLSHFVAKLAKKITGKCGPATQLCQFSVCTMLTFC